MNIVLVAGGSGGHIYPALSLAQSLKERNHHIVFIGANDRMEKEVIPAKGFPFIGLNIATTRGGISQKAKSLLTMTAAFVQARKYLKMIKADVVVGFGNYISVPVLLAARNLRLKTMIHEQNSFVGRANLLLDRKVNTVIGSYEENRRQFRNPHLYILGNPQSSIASRQDVQSGFRESLGFTKEKKLVTFFFGSLGSESLCKVVCDLIDSVQGDYQILYATGKLHYAAAKVHEKATVRIVESVDGIAAMRESDLLVSRAGATTLAEITAVGVPAVLIPSPYVPNNHQLYNAQALTAKGAAVLLEEKDTDARKLERLIRDLLGDAEKRDALSRNASALANPHVIEEIMEKIESL